MNNGVGSPSKVIEEEVLYIVASIIFNPTIITSLNLNSRNILLFVVMFNSPS